MVGFAFKVTAAPFHWWAPDTYEGAPTPVTAYFSVSSKAAGFVGLLLITYLALPDAASIWGPALWLLAVVSMTLGNLSALRQRNIVRLLAYSSVAQAGFMMVPFAGAAVDGSDLSSRGHRHRDLSDDLRHHEPRCLRRGDRRGPQDRDRRDRRLGRARVLRPRARAGVGAVLLLARRDPTAGRVVRQVRHVPGGDRHRQPVDAGAGGDRRHQHGDRAGVLRPGGQGGVDGPGAGNGTRRAGTVRWRHRSGWCWGSPP